MQSELFTGNLVHLTAIDAVAAGQVYSRWSRDSEFWRLMGSGACMPFSPKKAEEWFEKDLDKDDPSNFLFSIRTLNDDQLIGDVGLDGIHWNHGDTFVGIGIGEREFWSKGYGSDAMRIILRFAFSELNLWRISLNVFEYNPRAIRSYEKVGFVHEGRMRQYLNRAGRRWDLIFMGITRPEWERNYQLSVGAVVE